MQLEGKTVVLGVTGSIAAYKAANLASLLRKMGCDVTVILTRNAANFIHPITFETLTGNRCLTDTFDRNFSYSVEHVALAKRADVLLIAPASADVIGKLAHGIADDMLTTTALACECPRILAPAMNTAMYHNPVVQDNLSLLRHYGYEIVAPASGRLACGDEGEGKLPDEGLLAAYVKKAVTQKKDLAGRRVLVTAGATREPLDPVRFLTNRSTGKMGFAMAEACALRGADVTVVAGHTEAPPPCFADLVRVESAQEMFEAVRACAPQRDLVVMAAAVSDYRPLHAAQEKIKKSDGDRRLELTKNPDILAYLGAHRQPGQFLCGFSMETENLLEHSREKLQKKQVDMIVANDLREPGAGFGTDTNVVTILTGQRETTLPCMEKEEAANRILDEILRSEHETDADKERKG